MSTLINMLTSIKPLKLVGDLTLHIDIVVKIVLFCSVVDSKCEYPAACNAMEVLLLHSSLLQEGSFFTSLINTLRRNKVSTNFVYNK